MAEIPEDCKIKDSIEKGIPVDVGKACAGCPKKNCQVKLAILKRKELIEKNLLKEEDKDIIKINIEYNLKTNLLKVNHSKPEDMDFEPKFLLGMMAVALDWIRKTYNLGDEPISAKEPTYID